MMSFRMPISARKRKSGRFVYRVQAALQKALHDSGMRQTQVAQELGVDRSLVNRWLSGRANLTLRSISDLADAMDHDIAFELVQRARQREVNEFQIPVDGDDITSSSSNRVQFSAPNSESLKFNQSAVTAPKGMRIEKWQIPA